MEAKKAPRFFFFLKFVLMCYSRFSFWIFYFNEARM